MKILVIEDQLGMCLDLVMALEGAGHEVGWFIKDKTQADVGEGLVDAKRLKSWSTQVSTADVVVFGDLGFSKWVDALRGRGKAVIGGNVATDRLETDRGFATSVAEGAGLKVPKSETFKFTEIDKAIKYVQKQKRCVLKPNSFDAPRWMSYVADGPDDMVALLEFVRTDKPENVGNSFLIQEYVDGVEVSIGAFFNGFKWVKPSFLNFEIKGFMEGGRGPNVDAAAAGKYFGRNRLFTEVLQKMTIFLRAQKVAGYFDANCIVNQKGPWLLEFTSFRFGYPTILLQNELMREDWGSFLFRLGSGAVSNLKVMSRWGCGVDISTLPSPLETRIEDYKGMPITFPASLDHIRLAQVAKRGDHFMTAGTSGFICEAVGHAINFDEAAKRAYKLVDTIKVPAKMYRADVGEVVSERIEQLQKWGYI